MHALRVCALIAGWLSLSLPAAGASPFDTCLELPEGSQRASCLGRQAAEFPRTVRAARGLASFLPDRPAELVEILDRLGAVPGEDDPVLAAELLDLRGQALLRLERFPEAADAFGSALDLDDGTIRMRWSAGDEQAWAAALDPGAGRIERAARGLLSAGQEGPARSLLARALALGATGWPAEAWEEAGGGEVPGVEGGTPLITPAPPRVVVPDIAIPRADGGAVSLADMRGSVLILDFWASWCVPCAEELPHLQALYEAERERGLAAVAVNHGEPKELALAYAKALKLTMPIGMYADHVDEALQVFALPTVIVADRKGRIRGRWDGFKPGIEKRIADLVRRLLADDSDQRVELAQLIRGDGLLRVEWMREGPTAVEGLAVLPEPDGTGRVVAGFASHLVLFDHDGMFGGRHRIRPTAGRVRHVELDAEGTSGLIVFRPGSTRLVLCSADAEEITAWQSPSPVLDVAALPAAADGPGEVLLGTIGGLVRAFPDGGKLRQLEGLREVSDLAVVPGADGPRVITLDAGSRLSWLAGPDLSVERQWNGPAGSWTLAAGPATGTGAGSAPPSVTSAVTGRFLPGGGTQAAVAVGGQQLVLLDTDSGEVRLRARWDGIRHLESADFDADGQDELIVGSGKRVALLRAVETARVADSGSGP